MQSLQITSVQAFGAGQIDSLATIWQRTVAFLGVHCVGLTAVVVSIPHILPTLGWDPALCKNMAIYTLALVPSIWLDVLNRYACYSVSPPPPSASQTSFNEAREKESWVSGEGFGGAKCYTRCEGMVAILQLLSAGIHQTE